MFTFCKWESAFFYDLNTGFNHYIWWLEIFSMILRLFKDVVFKWRTRKTQRCIQCDFMKWFAWAEPINLAHMRVITIRNKIRYQIICIYFETFQSLWSTNIVRLVHDGCGIHIKVVGDCLINFGAHESSFSIIKAKIFFQHNAHDDAQSYMALVRVFD
jgi:hypothetical protein